MNDVGAAIVRTVIVVATTAVGVAVGLVIYDRLQQRKAQ